MTRELHPNEELDEGYWESLGATASKFDGPPPGHDQDPFRNQPDAPGQSRYVPIWLRSYGGIEFIDVFIGDFPGSDDSHELVFLYQVPGADSPKNWNLGRCPSKNATQGGWIAEGATYEEVRTWAEQYGRDNSVDTGGNADWRLADATSGQRNLLARMPVKTWDGKQWVDLDDATIVTKGQASDALNQHFASKTLDPSFT